MNAIGRSSQRTVWIAGASEDRVGARSRTQRDRPGTLPMLGRNIHSIVLLFAGPVGKSRRGVDASGLWGDRVDATLSEQEQLMVRAYPRPHPQASTYANVAATMAISSPWAAACSPANYFANSSLLNN